MLRFIWSTALSVFSLSFCVLAQAHSLGSLALNPPADWQLVQQASLGTTELLTYARDKDSITLFVRKDGAPDLSTLVKGSQIQKQVYSETHGFLSWKLI